MKTVSNLYSTTNLLGHEQICLMRLIEHIRWWRLLGYLKFIVISGEARTQKSRNRVSQKESLQRHSLDITFFSASRTIFFQEHYPCASICLSAYLSFTHKSINIVSIFFRKRDDFSIIKSNKMTNLEFLLFIDTWSHTGSVAVLDLF